MDEDPRGRSRVVVIDGKSGLTGTIAVLSDRALYRDGIVELLRQYGFSRVDGFSSAAGLLRAARGAMLDLALVDLAHDRDDPERVMGGLRAVCPKVTVVAIGTSLQLAARASRVDGRVELPRDGAQQLSAMAAAIARRQDRPVKFPVSAAVAQQSRTWASLTPRQRQVLGLLGCGLENVTIAASLGISVRAIKGHVSGLLEKFEVDNRTELALIACRAGFAAAV